MKRLAMIVLSLGAIALAGCGVRGDLERPPPVFGPDNRTPAERAYENDNADDGAPSADEAPSDQAPSDQAPPDQAPPDQAPTDQAAEDGQR